MVILVNVDHDVSDSIVVSLFRIRLGHDYIQPKIHVAWTKLAFLTAFFFWSRLDQRRVVSSLVFGHISEKSTLEVRGWRSLGLGSGRYFLIVGEANRELLKGILTIWVCLSHGPARLSVESTASNIKNNIIRIKCFHDYPTMEESSAFISHPSMKFRF